MTKTDQNNTTNDQKPQSGGRKLASAAVNGAGGRREWCAGAGCGDGRVGAAVGGWSDGGVCVAGSVSVLYFVALCRA